MMRGRLRALVVVLAAAGTVLSLPAALAVENADSVGVVDQTTGLWYLRSPNGDTTSFYFGNPGDYPIMGDWDCDGIDTPGLYRQSDGYVYLRNSNTQGTAEVTFFFGNPGDQPLAGDFNGDGCDTVSIYRPAEARVFVINELGSDDGGLGAADFDFYFGNVGDKPFTADFNDNGHDTVGLHRESTGFVYYRTTLTTGIADNEFFYGDPGDQIISGRWVQNPTDGPETVGIFRPNPGHFYLRFTNSEGNADRDFPYGNANMSAVAGTFGDLPGTDLPPPSTLGAVTVTNIVDGDTFDGLITGIEHRIRIIGIDTPEAGQCYFQEAKDRLGQLLPIGHSGIWVEKDVSEVDRFGRLLRYVYRRYGRPLEAVYNIGYEMVWGGYAYATPYPPDTAQADLLADAEAQAQVAGRGLWSACVDPEPSCDPSYPTLCIPPPPPDLDCPDIPYRNFTVLPPDPHRFDGNNNGIDCET